MKKPIVIYTLEQDGDVFAGSEEEIRAWGVDPEQAVATSDGALKRHEVHLHDPLTYAMQLQVEKAVKMPDSRGLLVEDETLRPQAMVEAYVERWTFPGVTPTADGYKRLHPNIAALIYPRILARVFPSLAASEGFFSILRKIQEAKDSKLQETHAPEKEKAEAPMEANGETNAEEEKKAA